jgi:hypothetical protein
VDARNAPARFVSVSRIKEAKEAFQAPKSRLPPEELMPV